MTVDLLKIAKRLALVAGVSAVYASGAHAAGNTSTLSAVPATANIVRPIVLTKDADMLFGNVVADAASVGTAILDNADGVTFGGAATAPGTTVGTRNSAAFTVTGEGSFTYALTLPSAAVQLSDTASTPNTMNLDTFTSSIGATGTLSGVAGAQGTQSFKVGATLHVGIAQPAGLYSGSFAVTVAYN